MTRNNILAIRMLAMLLLVVLSSSCTENTEKKEETGIIGLQQLSTNDELNIVNWTVDGIVGDPKLSSVDWELKNDMDSIVWSGIAVKYTETPNVVGVYYIDVNQNNSIDVGDTFCVKTPGDGHYILRWYIGEGYGEYMADY